MCACAHVTRREDKLKLPHGWICYLAPEIVRRMGPGNHEDQLPFSNAADVYAFRYFKTPLLSPAKHQGFCNPILLLLYPTNTVFLSAIRDYVKLTTEMSILSTIWYELQAGDWPIKNHPAEATIWLVGSGQGIKKVLSEVSLGKEVTVRSHISLS